MARKDLLVGAECLLAYQRGEDTAHALAGAMIQAEHYEIQRLVNTKK